MTEQSEITSVWLKHKLDFPRHQIPEGRAAGSWKHTEVTFQWAGHNYTATVKHDIGSETRQCVVMIHKYGLTALVDRPPRNHYYDDDGDPQYQPRPDLWKRWEALAGPISQAQISLLVLSVLATKLAGLPPPNPVGERTVAVEALLDDFIHEGFLPVEFPLLFLDLSL